MLISSTSFRLKQHSRFQRQSVFKHPVAVALSLLAGVAVNQAPTQASVTIDLDNEVATFVNDGDSGYYIKEESSSSRVQADDVFKMPVGSDGRPRWQRCTEKPCPKIPTPQSAPGTGAKQPDGV